MLFKNSVLYPGNERGGKSHVFTPDGKNEPGGDREKSGRDCKDLKSWETLDKMPEELSAADTYRVLLGRALMRCPGILLLDRTIAEADPDVQEVMRKEFANINRELGITVIYATDSQKRQWRWGQG